MTSLTSTNVFTISCLSIEPNYSYYSSTIRGLFALFVDYSRTIRTIRRLFADYSYYSSTIRTIRTIRFTILVLSIAILKACVYKKHGN
jgi:hypothetical protein